MTYFEENIDLFDGDKVIETEQNHNSVNDAEIVSDDELNHDDIEWLIVACETEIHRFNEMKERLGVVCTGCIDHYEILSKKLVSIAQKMEKDM